MNGVIFTMLMNSDWPENRAYIENRYDARAYDPATGLDNAAIRAGLDKMFFENPKKTKRPEGVTR